MQAEEFHPKVRELLKELNLAIAKMPNSVLKVQELVGTTYTIVFRSMSFRSAVVYLWLDKGEPAWAINYTS